MNKDKRNNIQLLGTLNNADESGIIANANQIYDANEDKSTQDVSKEHTERIKTLEDKENSMQTTLENITKTGEASAASNVTYNHSDSKLDATNVQQAVDEVRKRSNYNDGDNIIDFNTIHLITDNPEFVCVAVDVNEKILYGIKTDGQPYFGVGCPQQVKDYIDKQINKILGTDDVSSTIDSLKEIEAFLKDFTNSDTLKKLLDLKANVDEVRATTDDIYKKSNPNDSEGNVVDTNTIFSIKDNPDYIKVATDNVGKLIEAIGIDGIRKFFAGIEVQGTLQCVTDNPEYTIAWVDKENRIIFAIQNDGNPYFGYGVPKQIKTVIDKLNDDLVNKQSLSETKTDIDKKINLGNDIYPSAVHEVSDVEDYKSLLLDNLNHILESVDADGVRNFFAGIKVAGNKFTATDNPEYKAVLLDKDNKIFIGIRNDGDVYFGYGVPKQIKDAIKDAINAAVTNSSRTIRVAAFNSSSTDIAEADYVCTGTNDELIIQKAIDAAGVCGKVSLAVGLYNIDSFKTASDGGYPYALLFKTNTKVKLECEYGNALLTATNNYQEMSSRSAILRITDTCYNALDKDTIYCVIRNQAPAGSFNTLMVSNIGISIPNNQKKIIGIDCWYSLDFLVDNVRIVTITGTAGTTPDYSIPPEGSIGFRGSQGSNSGIRDRFMNCSACGFYEGFAISGEHFIGISLLARNNYYGFTFNKYKNKHGAYRHPITMINCADELSARMPYFGHNGEYNQTPIDKQGQAITFIDFNMEWLSNFRNQEGGGIYATEELPGEWSGSIHYTIQPTYGGSEKSDPTLPFWANDGSGKNIKSFNDGQAQQTDKETLKTYAPNYNQIVYCTDLHKPLICTNPATKEWRDFTGEIITL